MDIAAKIYRHSLNLPEEAAREALDFVEFLEGRYAPKTARVPPSSEWECQVLALAGSLSDDFPDEIDELNLAEDTPRAPF